MSGPASKLDSVRHDLAHALAFIRVACNEVESTDGKPNDFLSLGLERLSQAIELLDQIEKEKQEGAKERA
jgi:hypothetical protein